MGLDIVELGLAVEHAFEIALPDEEASKVVTVGDLYTLVLSKVNGLSSPRCLTSAAFYQTRRAIMEALGVERIPIPVSLGCYSLLATPLMTDGSPEVVLRIKNSLPSLTRTELCVLELPPEMFQTSDTVQSGLTV